MDFSDKLKAMRRSERVTQTEFCELVGFSISSYKKYESSIYEMGYASLCKILVHPKFHKYALWLMTDQSAPKCGQVSPE